MELLPLREKMRSSISVRILVGSFIVVLCVCLFPFCGLAATFRDWEVECDNINGCSALGFSSDDADATGYIRIDRLAGPANAANISIVLQHDEKLSATDAQLAIDEKPVRGINPVRKAATNDDDVTSFRIAAEEVKPFIEALRNGHTLQLTTVDGKMKTVISLNGAVAALLKIDDVQGRAGTETALIRVGDKPASSVPLPPALPVIVAAKPPSNLQADPALAKKLRKVLLQKDADCDDLTENVLTEDDTVDALTPSLALVGISCMRGAYQGATQFWIVENGNISKAYPVAFKEPGRSEKDPSTANELTSPSFDKETGSIGFFAKGRGLGDCGAAGTYVWTGRSFELSEYSALEKCQGVPMESWPVLWRSERKEANK
jgi:hypothetical protein